MHVRLGDKVEEHRTQGVASTFSNSIQIVSSLKGLLGGARNVRLVVVTDSSPEELASFLRSEQIDVELDGAGGALFGPVDAEIVSGGNPLVAIHCLASADVVFTNEKCRDGNNMQCSFFLRFAHMLSLGIVFPVTHVTLSQDAIEGQARTLRDGLATRVATSRSRP